MQALGQIMWQTWRSIVSFFMSFVVLGLMVWFTPDWVEGFVSAASSLKGVVMEASRTISGYDQPSALFSILVGDTAIALALMTLFTRVVVLTLIMWIGGLIFSAIFGSRQSSH